MEKSKEDEETHLAVGRKKTGKELVTEMDSKLQCIRFAYSRASSFNLRASEGGFISTKAYMATTK